MTDYQDRKTNPYLKCNSNFPVRVKIQVVSWKANDTFYMRNSIKIRFERDLKCIYSEKKHDTD